MNCLSVIERCPYYGGVRKERFDCILLLFLKTFLISLFFAQIFYFLEPLTCLTLSVRVFYFYAHLWPKLFGPFIETNSN